MNGSTSTPNSDLTRYSVDVVLLGFGARKKWRCSVYFDGQKLDSFTVEGGSFKTAEYQAKERAVAIAARYVDITT